MPQIPIITAEGAPAVAQFPAQVPIPDFRRVEGFGARAAEFGAQLNEIGAKLQAQQNELDTAGLVGKFHGKMKELAVDVRVDEPDPMKRSKLFADRSAEVLKELTDTAPNRLVGIKFQEFAAKYLPVYAANVHDDALQFMGEQQIAQTRDTLDSFSRLYSQSTTDGERKAWLQAGIKIIDDNIHFKPEQAQKERKNFIQKSQTSYMKILGSTNIEELRARNEQKEFEDVDPLLHQKILDSAERMNATRLREARVALDKAVKVWGEGVEIAGARLMAENKMDQEFINTYAGQMAQFADGRTVVASWQKRLREQQEGFGVGDPTVERQMRADLTDVPDPRKSLQELRILYANGKVGSEFYDQKRAMLEAQIHRRDDQNRSDKNAGESRIQVLQSNRYQAAKQQADLAFKTTGILGKMDQYDQMATEAHGQFMEELNRRTDHLNANGEDSLAVSREILPKYLSNVQSRLNSRLDLLKSKVSQYPNIRALDAARSQIGELAYYENIRTIQEIFGIESQQARIDAELARGRQETATAIAQGKGKTTKPTSRFGESK